MGLAKVLEAQAHLSDRQIGKMLKTDHKTVAKVRKEKEDVGTIPRVAKRQDRD